MAFCRDWLQSWRDRHAVKYVVGIARNERLLALAAPSLKKAERAFVRTQQKQRLFTAFDYAALTWSQLLFDRLMGTPKNSNILFANSIDIYS